MEKNEIIVTKKELLNILLKLKKPIVLTKNKKQSSAKNFRPDPNNPNVMLDGYWLVKPKGVKIGDFCAHYKTHSNELWIGTYDGIQPSNKKTDNAKQSYSLKIQNPKKYKIIDIDKPNSAIDSILISGFLHKNASVIYTYLPGSVNIKTKNRALISSDRNDDFTGKEKLRLLSTRVNHGRLRNRTIKEFEGICCLSGIDIPELLVCSHIKPWSKSKDFERTDRNNVLLLASNWDSVFDKGFISVQDNGDLLFSNRLTDDVKKSLGISRVTRIDQKHLTPERRQYFAYHRNKIFVMD